MLLFQTSKCVIDQIEPLSPILDGEVSYIIMNTFISMLVVLVQDLHIEGRIGCFRFQMVLIERKFNLFMV